jgi:ABC-type Fe3+-siderophore transport system permease subunit
LFGVTLSILFMALSGLAMYIAPQGRLATQIGWRWGGLARAQWETLHTATSMLFVGFVIWHFWVHLAVYKTLLFGSATRRGHTTEVWIAVFAVLVVVLTAILGWPPASWIADLGGFFKREFWGAAIQGH